ncbi:copper amine oxidase domain protein [Thermoanaerobacterium thermosaccharolyticum DSM 571]|uniref:Copper amine oxidase domain protein n=1 Tax=Thermoanaerobacterium thermosaccharolyticum (strain ATCC 7956 / DSM 571 / NCIMB 9385 / NCA 3814 / NCTC 13789 / WDCM 00135 / 2032) TaxID=580327 RepID=D9TM53_THETC|nr:copper amine oxidase N-terminal domain-containing protein [Thermoanaerobacterium thermosaccharolyticum]ADL70034.1 copper amine oxidase domain protein [Thermoanaerobacterium thermosaccharolyticum DSM 571]
MVKSKWLSFVLVFAMLVSMFVPMGMTNAFAAGTSYTSLTVPSISDDSTTKLGTFMIDIDPYATQSEALIELPNTDYKIYDLVIGNPTDSNGTNGREYTNFDKIPNNVSDAVYNGTLNDNDRNPISFSLVKTSSNGFKLSLTSSGTNKELKIPVSFKSVNVPSGASGDIKATITNISGQLTSGSVVVATIGSGDITVSAIDTNTFSDAGGPVELRIAESTSGKLNAKDQLKLELPDGFKWGTVTDKKIVYGTLGRSGDISNVVFTVDGDTLKINLADDKYKSTDKVSIDFVASINVTDTDKAKYGDIIAKVKGDYTATPSEITVGTYGDYSATVKAVDSSTVAYAGQNDQGVSDIEIKEAIQGSLIEGRTILITLPSNARWFKIDDTVVDKEKNNKVDDDNGVELDFVGLQGTDNRTAKFQIKGGSTGKDKPADLKIENISVALDSGITGDLVATVSGSAGLSGDITLAKVVNPVTVTADKTNVKLGVSAQAAGDITISEYKDGAIDTNDGSSPVVLDLPDGVKFAAKPTVTVTSGDIEVDHVSLTNDDNTLEIYFKDDSNTASTIKVSGIKYDVDRTVGEGDIQVKVAGKALITVPNDLDNYQSDSNYDTWKYADVWFSGDNYVAKVANATVVTPAPNATNQTAVFTINSTTYTVNGVQNTLDSAPYVKNGRTYLPTRYVAYALGVSSDNVLWDGTKATFILGNRVVQVTPGSTTLTINGAPVTMDAPAEIVNGRVMVPFRWIAQAFGAQVQWDATNQTVTMTLKAQ